MKCSGSELVCKYPIHTGYSAETVRQFVLLHDSEKTATEIGKNFNENSIVFILLQGRIFFAYVFVYYACKSCMIRV